jgi:hypothetical protein
VCLPHNASYDLQISSHHGVQIVTTDYSVGDGIPSPVDNLNSPSDLTQHAYGVYMRVLCDRLVGKMAWYAEPSAITSNTTVFARRANRFGVIEFPSRRIGLHGSLNLDAFFEFDEENGLYEDKNVSRIFDLSDQQLRVKVLARNRTLEVLIEELSFNTTISLMHNALPM